MFVIFMRYLFALAAVLILPVLTASELRQHDPEILAAAAPYERPLPKASHDLLEWYCARSFVDDSEIRRLVTERLAARAKLFAKLNSTDPRQRAQQRFLQQLHIPREILNGDMAVSVDSATAVAADVQQQYKLPHWKLANDGAVLKAVCAFISEQE